MVFKTPCETAIWKIIPTARKEIVVYLVKEKKMPRKDVEKLVGVTLPAISQYMKNKRGTLEFTKKEKLAVKLIGDELIKKPKSSEKILAKGMCKLCTIMKCGCKWKNTILIMEQQQK